MSVVTCVHVVVIGASQVRVSFIGHGTPSSCYHVTRKSEWRHLCFSFVCAIDTSEYEKVPWLVRDYIKIIALREVTCGCMGGVDSFRRHGLLLVGDDTHLYTLQVIFRGRTCVELSTDIARLK